MLKGYKDPAAIAANGCTGDADQMVTGGVKLTSNSQTYGKYEVRMRVDNGQGVSAGRPALAHRPTPGHPRSTSPRTTEHPHEPSTRPPNTGERDTNVFQVNNTLTVNLTQWHTVGVEWTPGKIVYTMDGIPWATETNANVSDVPMQVAVQTQAWQCGTSNSWEECANGSTPAEVDMDVDWIAVYALGS